ncbi:MAG: rod-binding protein [Magnetococcales bacterium]|nr:rod-binding protein [Magnetococcales bacterium]
MSTVPITLASSAAQKKTLSEQDQVGMKKALGDFESIFLQQMLSTMRQTVPETGIMGQKSQGEKIFRDMMDSEYAKLLSKRENGQGIKEMMYRQLSLRLGKASAGVEDQLKQLQKQGDGLNSTGAGSSTAGGGSVKA